MKRNFFYQTGIDITNAKSMFDFLNDHFMYDTLNSWNNVKSIANNVKLYNLKLEGDWCEALSFIFDEGDCGSLQHIINDMIEDWEYDHPKYQVGFNGRSSGYIVLYNKDNCRNILPDYLLGYDNYEDFKQSIKESWYNESVKDYIPILRDYTKLVRDFDRLCDDIRLVVNEYSKLNFEEEQKKYNFENGISEED